MRGLPLVHAKQMLLKTHWINANDPMVLMCVMVLLVLHWEWSLIKACTACNSVYRGSKSLKSTVRLQPASEWNGNHYKSCVICRIGGVIRNSKVDGAGLHWSVCTHQHIGSYRICKSLAHFLRRFSNFLKQLVAVLFIKQTGGNTAYVGNYFQWRIDTQLVL